MILVRLFLLCFSLYCNSSLDGVGVFLRALKAFFFFFEVGQSDGVESTNMKTSGWVWHTTALEESNQSSG